MIFFTLAGQDSNVLGDLYQELVCLKHLSAALSAGEIAWNEEVGNNGGVPVVTATKNLLTELQTAGTLHLNGKNDKKETDEKKEEDGMTNISTRQDYDFTDRLWKNLFLHLHKLPLHKFCDRVL